jgi:hypothetical protein
MRTACVLLALATTACNSILGVTDVELGAPDAPPAQCDVIPHFASVSSVTSATNLIHGSRGNPSLLFVLNSDPKPDSLTLQLYDDMGGHGKVNTPGEYKFTSQDTKVETCGLCVFINTDFDAAASSFSQTYLALAQGSLMLDTADATRLTGSMLGLKLRHVTTSGSTTDAGDGCEVTIDRVVFDVAYETTAAAAHAALR